MMEQLNGYGGRRIARSLSLFLKPGKCYVSLEPSSSVRGIPAGLFEHRRSGIHCLGNGQEELHRNLGSYL